MTLPDEFAFNGDVGRIAVELREPLEESVVCPRVAYPGRGQVRPTMAKIQCALRILEGNKCTAKCAVAMELKRQYPLHLGVVGDASPNSPNRGSKADRES